VRLEALRGSERRVVRLVGMVGLTLDETLSAIWQPYLKQTFEHIYLLSTIYSPNTVAEQNLQCQFYEHERELPQFT